jgi:hypothetical protein
MYKLYFITKNNKYMDAAATNSSSDLPCSISHPLIGWIRQIMSPLHNRFSFAIVRVHSHLDLIHIIHLLMCLQ